MAFKDKPLPPAIEEWAKSADAPAGTAKKERTMQQQIVSKMQIPETKAQVSFRLAPSIQWRVKKLAMHLSSPTERVTAQDLMEKAIMQFLAKNEPQD